MIFFARGVEFFESSIEHVWLQMSSEGSGERLVAGVVSLGGKGGLAGVSDCKGGSQFLFEELHYFPRVVGLHEREIGRGGWGLRKGRESG